MFNDRSLLLSFAAQQGAAQQAAFSQANQDKMTNENRIGMNALRASKGIAPKRGLSQFEINAQKAAADKAAADKATAARVAAVQAQAAQSAMNYQAILAQKKAQGLEPAFASFGGISEAQKQQAVLSGVGVYWKPIDSAPIVLTPVTQNFGNFIKQVFTPVQVVAAQVQKVAEVAAKQSLNVTTAGNADKVIQAGQVVVRNPVVQAVAIAAATAATAGAAGAALAASTGMGTALSTGIASGLVNAAVVRSKGEAFNLERTLKVGVSAGVTAGVADLAKNAAGDAPQILKGLPPAVIDGAAKAVAVAAINKANGKAFNLQDTAIAAISVPSNPVSDYVKAADAVNKIRLANAALQRSKADAARKLELEAQQTALLNEQTAKIKADKEQQAKLEQELAALEANIAAKARAAAVLPIAPAPVPVTPAPVLKVENSSGSVSVVASQGLTKGQMLAAATAALGAFNLLT